MELIDVFKPTCQLGKIIYPRRMTHAAALCHSSFPIYCVKVLGDHHVVVAGGGGKAKSGVPNLVELYGLDYDEGFGKLIKVGKYDTGSKATMNMDIHEADNRFLLALGQDGNCNVVEATGRMVNAENNADAHSRRVGMQFDQLKSVQTDFPPSGKARSGAYQKVVRFAPCGSFLLTGGSDGHFRMWSYPSMQKKLDQYAYKDDVEDLDVSFDSKLILSVGRNGHTHVWQCKGGAKLLDIHSVKQQSGAVPDSCRVRFARFVKAEKQAPNNHLIVTCSIPVARNSRRQSNFLTLWRLESNKQGSWSCKRLISKPIGQETISAIAIGNCGKRIAFGTLGGSLMVVDLPLFTLIKSWPKAHSIFVTSVDLLPSRSTSKITSFDPMLLSTQNVGLVSVSADNSCQIHIVDAHCRWSFSKKFLLSTLVINLTFLSFKLLQLFNFAGEL